MSDDPTFSYHWHEGPPPPGDIEPGYAYFVSEPLPGRAVVWTGDGWSAIATPDPLPGPVVMPSFVHIVRSRDGEVMATFYDHAAAEVFRRDLQNAPGNHGGWFITTSSVR